MTTFVVDSSVALQWFREEEHSHEARALTQEDLIAPPLLYLEVLNVAGRRWRWHEEALLELLRQVGRTGLLIEEPPLHGITRWVAQGLTAYDASYVALAEAHECGLVTADAQILELASEIARGLGP